MTDKTEESTACKIDVPDDLWPEITDGVAKVVLTGVGASALPPDIFLKALKDNGIINDIKATKVNIPFSKRKRVVYGCLKFKHKQSFSIQYKQNEISFLILDPNDTRVEMTLLHMLINTTKEIITYIFNAINPKWIPSDIRLEPGIEQRHDRWQLMLQCNDVKDIPHHFILPKRGPEKENLTIKLFVTGRVSPCAHCQGDHRSSQCQNPPPPHRPEPRNQAAVSQPCDAGVPLLMPSLFDQEKLISSQPENFKNIIKTAGGNEKLPTCEILKNILMNSGPASTIVEECDLEYSALRGEPILISRSKEPPLFTRFPHEEIDSMQTEQEKEIQQDIDEKVAAMVIFLHLFKSCNLHDTDYKKLRHFVFGKSSYDRSVIWLCQLANFLETGKLPVMGEIPADETETEYESEESEESESV